MLLLLFALAAGGGGDPVYTQPPPAVAARGVPRWLGRINGRSVHGSYEEVMAQLRHAAQVDGAQAAEAADTSKRELKRQARIKAQEAVQQVDLGPNPYDLGDTITPGLIRQAKADEAQIAKAREQHKAMRKAYLEEYERSMVMNAQLLLAQDNEDMDDMNDIMEML